MLMIIECCNTLFDVLFTFMEFLDDTRVFYIALILLLSSVASVVIIHFSLSVQRQRILRQLRQFYSKSNYRKCSQVGQTLSPVVIAKVLNSFPFCVLSVSRKWTFLTFETLRNKQTYVFLSKMFAFCIDI